MLTSARPFQVQIEIANKPQLDRGLRLFERLLKFTLLIFRSNEEEPKVSVPRLVLALILFLLSEFWRI